MQLIILYGSRCYSHYPQRSRNERTDVSTTQHAVSCSNIKCHGPKITFALKKNTSLHILVDKRELV